MDAVVALSGHVHGVEVRGLLLCLNKTVRYKYQFWKSSAQDSGRHSSRRRFGINVATLLTWVLGLNVVLPSSGLQGWNESHTTTLN